MQKLVNIFTIIILSVFLIFTHTSNVFADNSKYIPDRETKRNIVSTYLKYNQTTDAYLIDMLVNENHHGSKVAKLNDSGIYFYYEAQEYLYAYKNKKNQSFLDKALQSIDVAIKKDPCSLNYYLKSYLLSQKGNVIQSDKVFEEGINKPYNCIYTTRGSEAFVRMISASCDANVYNLFLFVSDIGELTIDTKFYIYTYNKLKQILNEPIFSKSDKQKILCGMINVVNTNNKAFYMLQYNIIKITNKLIINMQNDDISNTCSLKYDTEALKEPDDLNATLDKYAKSDNISDLEKSLFWRNFESMAAVLKVRK